MRHSPYQERESDGKKLLNQLERETVSKAEMLIQKLEQRLKSVSTALKGSKKGLKLMPKTEHARRLLYLERAEVWPQEKEHSGAPPHAFEIKPANCTAAGCAGRRGHPAVLSSTPLALGQGHPYGALRAFRRSLGACLEAASRELVTLKNSVWL